MDLFSILGTDLGKILDDTVKAENDRVKGISPTLRHRKTGPRFLYGSLFLENRTSR